VFSSDPTPIVYPSVVHRTNVVSNANSMDADDDDASTSSSWKGKCVVGVALDDVGVNDENSMWNYYCWTVSHSRTMLL
jgi:hypothetical protein